MDMIELPEALVYDAIYRLENTGSEDNWVAALVLRRRIGADVGTCVACGVTFRIEHPQQRTCVHNCEGA